MSILQHVVAKLVLFLSFLCHLDPTGRQVCLIVRLGSAAMVPYRVSIISTLLEVVLTHVRPKGHTLYGWNTC